MRIGKLGLTIGDVFGYVIIFAVITALLGGSIYFCWCGIEGLRQGGLVVGGGRGSVSHLVTRAAHPIQYWFYELLSLAMPLVILVPLLRGLLARRSPSPLLENAEDLPQR